MKLRLKYWIMAVVAVVTFAVPLLAFPAEKAQAISGTGYFTYSTVCTAGGCNGSAACPENDVMTGRQYCGDLSNLAIPNAVNTKADFINFINTNLQGGGTHNHNGAAFIVDTMLGLSRASGKRSTTPKTTTYSGTTSVYNEWVDRMNNPDIGIRSEWNDPNAYSGSTSFYGSNVNDTFFEGYNSGSRPLIVFFSKSTGKVFYVLERPCANPLGGLPGLKCNSSCAVTSAPNYTMQGTAYVNGQPWYGAVRNETVTFAFYVQRFGDTAEDITVRDEWAPLSAIPNNAVTGTIRQTTRDFGSDDYYTVPLTIPGNAARGTVYCARVIARPQSSTSNAWLYSNIVCAQVVVPDNYGPDAAISLVQCYRGVYGYAQDRDWPSGPMRLELLNDSDGVLATTYSQPGQTFSFNEPLPAVNVTNASPGFRVRAYDLNAYGEEDNAWAPYVSSRVTMEPCYDYNFAPVGGVELKDSAGIISTENPETVTFTASPIPNNTDLTIAGSKCVIGAQMTYTFYKIAANGTVTNYSSPVTTDPDDCLGYSSSVTSPPINIAGSVQAGDQYCVDISLTTVKGIIKGDGSQVINPPYAVSSGPQSFPKLGCQTISNRPVFKTFGSGIKAGGEFGSVSGTCSGAPSTGKIKGWFNNSNATGVYGAGSDLTVLALLQINGYASNHLSNNSTARPIIGRTFANTVNASGTSADRPNTGGMFAPGGSFCFPNPTLTNAQNVAPGPLIAGPTNGAYEFTGDYTVSPGNGVVKPKRNIALHLKDGDLYISGNVTYQGWTNKDDISSLTAIVDGNIYIDSSVTQVDGLYIARANSSRPGSGHIYSCYFNTQKRKYFDAEVYDNCNKQLVIHGSFVADSVDLLRTFGSLRNNQGGVVPCANNGYTAAVGSEVSRASCAAEVFDFSPEMYLAQPPVQYTQAGKYKYDAISSLPPVL